MTDIEKLKNIVKNGTCHEDISCHVCPLMIDCLMKVSSWDFLTIQIEKLCKTVRKNY